MPGPNECRLERSVGASDAPTSRGNSRSGRVGTRGRVDTRRVHDRLAGASAENPPPSGSMPDGGFGEGRPGGAVATWPASTVVESPSDGGAMGDDSKPQSIPAP